MTPFSLIPVLDLKDGRVVHARAGERATYRPIRSALAAGSDIFAITDGLMALAPFRRLYIADLDAIEGRGDHAPMIAELAARHAGVELWVDRGVTSVAAASVLAQDGLVPVLGSESLADAAVAAAAVARLGPRGCVLSLDYRSERFLGPPELEAQAELWPERVIVMSLSRVGMAAGPDLARLLQIRGRAPRHSLFAAGGVRDRADIDRLRASRITGALVASALHDGRLAQNAVADLAAER